MHPLWTPLFPRALLHYAAVTDKMLIKWSSVAFNVQSDFLSEITTVHTGLYFTGMKFTKSSGGCLSPFAPDPVHGPPPDEGAGDHAAHVNAADQRNLARGIGLD